MATYFDQVEVINLNSKFDGWIEDVTDIISDIDNRALIKNSVPRLPLNKLLKRLRELKYVCLVDDLTIIETRRIFQSVYFGEHNQRRNPFDDWYERMQDAPDSDDEEEYAVMELEEGVFINMPKALLPNLVEEGDVIIIEIDEEATDRRRNRIEEMMNNLLED